MPSRQIFTRSESYINFQAERRLSNWGAAAVQGRDVMRTASEGSKSLLSSDFGPLNDEMGCPRTTALTRHAKRAVAAPAHDDFPRRQPNTFGEKGGVRVLALLKAGPLNNDSPHTRSPAVPGAAGQRRPSAAASAASAASTTGPSRGKQAGKRGPGSPKRLAGSPRRLQASAATATPSNEAAFFIPEDASTRIFDWLRAPGSVPSKSLLRKSTSEPPNHPLAASSPHVRLRRQSSAAHDRAVFEHRLQKVVLLRMQLGGAVGPGAPRASRLLRAEGTRGRIPDEEFGNMFPTGDEIVEAKVFAPVRVTWAAPKSSAGMLLEVEARGGGAVVWRDGLCAMVHL
jgi:hypothetical protein